MKVLYALRDIIFPRHCVLCEMWMVDDQFHVPVCSLCVCKWPDLRGSIGGQLLLERLCLRWGHVGFRLRESSFLEQEVRAIKYRGAIRQARNWGAWLAEFSEPPHGSLNNVVLVPVPLHWKKKLKRGYNQAELIAEGIARQWKVPVWKNALTRNHHASSLTGMGRAERWTQLQDTYAANPSASFDSVQVILVDDVITTGATIQMCKEAIERGGGKVIGAMALALA